MAGFIGVHHQLASPAFPTGKEGEVNLREKLEEKEIMNMVLRQGWFGGGCIFPGHQCVYGATRDGDGDVSSNAFIYLGIPEMWEAGVQLCDD